MLNQETISILKEKAAHREDGIYQYKGNVWVAKNRRFLGFADYHGRCYQLVNSFFVSIGKVDRYERRKELKKWLTN